MPEETRCAAAGNCGGVEPASDLGVAGHEERDDEGKTIDGWHRIVTGDTWSGAARAACASEACSWADTPELDVAGDGLLHSRAPPSCGRQGASSGWSASRSEARDDAWSSYGGAQDACRPPGPADSTQADRTHEAHVSWAQALLEGLRGRGRQYRGIPVPGPAEDVDSHEAPSCAGSLRSPGAARQERAISSYGGFRLGGPPGDYMCGEC